MAGGAIAAKILKELGIGVRAYTKSIGPVSIDPARFDPDAILQTATAMPDREADERAREWLSSCMEEKDSSGGVVECVISGMPAGVGEPVFEKLDARLGSALFSIGAVKAVEIGDGTAVSSARGSENNDPFRMRDGRVVKSANHAGGVLGGISDGSDVVMRVHIKPTPSIFRPQDTVGADGQERTVCIRGRHDPVIVPRAVVVVECMAALTAADLLFSNMSARMDKILSFYGK